MRSARWWLLTAVTATASLTMPTVVEAQSEPTDGIDLVDQTIIVGAEPASFVLGIDGAEDEDLIAIRIHAPLTDRYDLHDTYEEPPRVAVISQFDRLASNVRVEGDDTYVITVPDDEVGLILRRDPGALPVVIRWIRDGRTLDTLVTSLFVVEPPVEGEEPGTVHLSFVAPIGAPLAHRHDEAVTNTFRELSEGLAALDALPAGATAVALRPESLAAADRAGGQESVDLLVEELLPHDVLLEPWVPIAEEGWRLAGEADMVVAQYAEGRSTIEELADRSPTGIVRLDAGASDATVGLLRTAGATAALVDASSLGAAALDSADDRPVHVRDENGVPMRSLVIDDRLPQTLADDDLELATHRALAELLLAAAAGGDRVVVLDLDAVEATALTRLLELAAGLAQVRTSPITTTMELPLARTSAGAIVEVRLRGEEPRDLADTADVQRFARASIDAYEGMVTSTQAPIVPLRTLLLASADDALDDEGRAAYTTAVIAAVARGTSGITILESERITLATRTADLPVTIRNEQTVPVTVALSLRGEKVRFPDGDQRTIELQPGDNTLTVRVEARASGDARVTASLRSPDGRLDLDETVIPIRSTALSGIGLLISAVALAVLLVWWIRTVRRTRRARVAATVPASAGDQADPGRGDPGAEGIREEP